MSSPHDAVPVMVSVPEDTLVRWYKLLEEAKNPAVEYNHDHQAMLANAYKKRGRTIDTVASELFNTITPP